MEAKYFAGRTKNAEILGNLSDKVMEKLLDRGCRKFRGLVDPKAY